MIAIGIAAIACLVIIMVLLGRRTHHDSAEEPITNSPAPFRDPTFGQGDQPFEGELDWDIRHDPRPVAPLWKAERQQSIREDRRLPIH